MKKANKTKTIMLRVTPRLYAEVYKRATVEEKSIPEIIRESMEAFLFSKGEPKNNQQEGASK